MFLTEKREDDERVFAVKPMNCPGHIQIFKNGLKSYRDLPLKIAEFGKVHRFEPSGALHGLMRVRAFTQDDAHIFITEQQIAEEALKINDLILSIYEDFGFADVRIKFSDRPGQAHRRRRGVGQGGGRADGRRSKPPAGPGRSTRAKARSTAPSSNTCCATPSAATGNAAPCRSTSTCRAGSAPSISTSTPNKVTPVMLHRAMFGSLERFTGILIEHYAGHLPLWLAPLQAVVATIISDADDYAREVAGGGAPRRAARRARPAQREDQLQGARALARQGAGAARRRQEGGRDPHRLDPPR